MVCANAFTRLIFPHKKSYDMSEHDLTCFIDGHIDVSRGNYCLFEIILNLDVIPKMRFKSFGTRKYPGT